MASAMAAKMAGENGGSRHGIRHQNSIMATACRQHVKIRQPGSQRERNGNEISVSKAAIISSASEPAKRRIEIISG
jgi:hypothetical protein